MKHISRDEISQMEKIQRLNLINSCTGYKSANLIATKSVDGKPNVAIFSSVTHLGSEPALNWIHNASYDSSQRYL